MPHDSINACLGSRAALFNEVYKIFIQANGNRNFLRLFDSCILPEII